MSELNGKEKWLYDAVRELIKAKSNQCDTYGRELYWREQHLKDCKWCELEDRATCLFGWL